MLDNLLKNTLKFPIILIKKINHDKVGIYTGQASFFMILSLFPIIMILLNLISRTTLIPNYIIPNYIERYLPFSVQEYLLSAIDQFQRASTGTMISISALLAIWAASKGAMAVILGLRLVLNSDKSTNWFILRIQSIIFTISLLLAFIISMILLVFGNSIYWNAAAKYSFLNEISKVYSISRYSIVLIILTLFFTFLFKIGANKSMKYCDLIPGAMFTTIGWMIFSYLFSIYVENFSNISYMYGSIAAIIIIMMWLYFCMYILFTGAEINMVIYEFDNKNSNTSQT